ncbi:MAG: metallophosphoesterase [Cyanobacteria bacterium HKST-UBA04]|nr:metallophosphoesterase [Cyanobacteria bacterium HKST-UBA04]
MWWPLGQLAQWGKQTWFADEQTKRVKALRIPYRFDCFSPQGHGAVSVEPAALAQTVKEAPTVVLGDLHGSVQKLVETLLAADFIEAPPEAFKQFRKAHEALVNVIFNQEGNRRLSAQQRELSRYCFEGNRKTQLFEAYQKVLAAMSAFEWKGKDRQLVLAGDVVNDRGALDLLTIALIRQLTESDRFADRIVTVVGNHDHDLFVNQMSLGSFSQIPTLSHRASFLRSRSLDPFVNQESQQAAFRWYLSRSRLLWYEPKTQTLVTHAPASPEEFRLLQNLLVHKGRCLPGPLASPEQLQTLADEANAFYCQYMETSFDRLRTFMQEQAVKTGHEDTPVEGVLIFDTVERDERAEPILGRFLDAHCDLKHSYELPFCGQAVATYVHGHTDSSKASRYEARYVPGVDDTWVGLDQPEGNYTVVNLNQRNRKRLVSNQHETSSLFVIPAPTTAGEEG